MRECPYYTRLGAFHDGELEPSLADAIRTHLATCPSCAVELAGLERLSQRLARIESPRISRIAEARLHQLADASAKSRRTEALFPVARALLAVAASVMVIAGAWLIETPSHRPVGGTVSIENAQLADWERLAVGGQLPPEVSGNSGLADTRFSEWMLQNLPAGREPGS